ncbi:MAG: sulfite exporter TauE/SafE family protein, partial [Anaerolineae bacterium]|nr:sulfite exporter TauE/SafE family protein [Anaerolineae bacterium]
LLLATLAGVPLGVALINWVDTAVLTTTLGILVLGYALYGLLSPRLPTLEHVGWAYGFGAVAGVLAGALNSAAPAVAMYGSARRWPPDVFRTNLQGYFLVVNTAVLLLHELAGNLTAVFWRSALWAIPGMLAGFGFGLWLAQHIHPARFTRMVLVLLLALGLNLIF